MKQFEKSPWMDKARYRIANKKVLSKQFKDKLKQLIDKDKWQQT